MRNKMSCLVLLCLFGLTVLAYQKDGTQSAWTPDKILAGKLDTTADVDDFQLRLPSAYQAKAITGPPGSLINAWVGPARSDGTRPSIVLTIQSVLDKDPSKNTLEAALKIFLENAEKRAKNWTRTALEKGSVNGLSFIRARWRGVNPTTGRIMHGFNYVTIKDRKVIQISSQDLEPHNKEGLDLAEAAALTFKKRF